MRPAARENYRSTFVGRALDATAEAAKLLASGFDFVPGKPEQ